MIGKFLEISVTTDDMLASLDFYKAMGFHELATNDARSYGYAAITDGHVTIGLHEKQFEQPTLTLVQPDLARSALQYSESKFLQSMTIDPDTFNEVSLHDPNGHPLSMVEARTYSPADTEVSDSLFGDFLEFTFPVSDALASAQFWAPFSLESLGVMQNPAMHMRLDVDGLPIGLSEQVRGHSSHLCYRVNDLAKLSRALRDQGVAIRPATIGVGDCLGQFMTKEGLRFSLLSEDFLEEDI